MKPLDPPSFVFLDAVRTLMDLHPDFYTLFSRIAEEAGWPRDEKQLRAAYDAEYYRVPQRLEGKTDFSICQERERTFWKTVDAAIFGRLGFDDSEARRLADVFFDEFESGKHWRLYDETLPALERLREAGIRMAIISNGTEGMDRWMRNSELADVMEFILVSAAVGWEKPGTEIFRMALERADVKAEEAIHVGDSREHDIAGAIHSGLRPVWIDRDGHGNGHKTAIPAGEPVAVIRHIGQLPDLLEPQPAGLD